MVAAGVRPLSLAVAALDDNGIQALAVTNLISQTVMVLLGLDDGGFLPGAFLPTRALPRSVIARDVKGGGLEDLGFVNALADTFP
ncbi:MAG: hypothetical protein ACE5JH_05095 [Acidobacteriota bacterium]